MSQNEYEPASNTSQINGQINTTSRSEELRRFSQRKTDNDLYSSDKNKFMGTHDFYQHVIIESYHINTASSCDGQDTTGSCITPTIAQLNSLNFRASLEFKPSGGHVSSHNNTPIGACAMLRPKDFLFEDKLAIVTDKQIRRDSKEYFYSHDSIEENEDLCDIEKTIREITLQNEPLSNIRVESRANSMDEVVNRYYNSGEGQNNELVEVIEMNRDEYCNEEKVSLKSKNEQYDVLYENEAYLQEESTGAETTAYSDSSKKSVEGLCAFTPSFEFSKSIRSKGSILLLSVILVVIFFLVALVVMSSFPVFTCISSTGLCVPQLTLRLVDKSPAAKAALLTVREALKVLSYLAIDFGDRAKDLELITNRLDSYYQSKVIDTFNVNTIYELNFLGYCRISAQGSNYFCMKSYGFDLIQVFVRDAGVQLGELTGTNIDIMGDSFAIAYELVITGFNELVKGSESEAGGTPDYVRYAILLQKLSRGLGFMSVMSFAINIILLAQVLSIFSLYLAKPRLLYYSCALNHIKKWMFISLNLLEFVNIVVGFLICSLTLEFVLKMNDIGSTVGIAVVNSGWGYVLLWISFVVQFVVFILCVYLTNEYRKDAL